MGSIKLKAVLFKGKVYKNGESPILIRLTKDRDSVYISTEYTARPSQWNVSQSCLYETIPRLTQRQKDFLSSEELKVLKKEYSSIELHSGRKKINEVLTKILGEIQAIIDRQKVLNKSITLKSIKEIYQSNEHDADLNFIKYAEKKRDELEALGQYRTFKRYKTVIKKLEEYQGRDLSFLDLNHDFLVKYEAHLKGLNNKTNTIHTNLKTIRAIYYKAIKEKLIEQSKNPFFTYTLKQDKHTKKEKLTLEEFIKIKKAKLKDTFLNDARNSFVFSFYNAGIRIGDLMQLKWGDITQDGRIEYKMDKQGGQSSIKLVPQSLEILKQYKPKKANKNAFIFPFLPLGIDKNGLTQDLYKVIESKTTKINNALDEIAKSLGIEKKVTNHISRHTFADLARKRKASVYDISKALGHSNIKQTESYLKSLDKESLDETMQNVLGGI